MAAPNKVVHQMLADGFVDLLGEDTNNFEKVKLSDTINTIEQLAAIYIGLISDKIDEQDLASSGNLQGKIKPTEVSFDGTTYRVGINAPNYASYQDEGVNGWAVNRNSRFNFKKPVKRKRGTFTGESKMVKTLKEYIAREGESARNVKMAVSSRERKGKSMPDPTTRAAVKMAYMIKKYGIKPKRFWSEATTDFIGIMEKELGTAIKIDVINNITQ